jgi:hypothetical protein
MVITLKLQFLLYLTQQKFFTAYTNEKIFEQVKIVVANTKKEAVMFIN